MSKNGAPKHPSFVLLILLLVSAAFVFRYFWWVADWFVPPDALHHATSVSDKISAAGALFSALAFVGLIYTILLQRHELLSQRLDQDELREQVTRQAFEGTFFQLLRLHNDNVRTQTVQLVTSGEVFAGRRAFAAAAAELEGTVAEHLRTHMGEPLHLADVNWIYSSICETPTSDFGHYFRNLYHIVKYVDTSSVPDRPRYIGQVRAQLSQSEFVLLLANGLRRSGKSKFKPLIERYGLLHEMRLAPHLEPLAAYYERAAFGTREAAV